MVVEIVGRVFVFRCSELVKIDCIIMLLPHALPSHSYTTQCQPFKPNPTRISVPALKSGSHMSKTLNRGKIVVSHKRRYVMQGPFLTRTLHESWRMTCAEMNKPHRSLSWLTMNVGDQGVDIET